jgi:hypothetical protein
MATQSRGYKNGDAMNRAPTPKERAVGLGRPTLRKHGTEFAGGEVFQGAEASYEFGQRQAALNHPLGFGFSYLRQAGKGCGSYGSKDPPLQRRLRWSSRGREDGGKNLKQIPACACLR